MFGFYKDRLKVSFSNDWGRDLDVTCWCPPLTHELFTDQVYVYLLFTFYILYKMSEVYFLLILYPIIIKTLLLNYFTIINYIKSIFPLKRVKEIVPMAYTGGESVG